MLKLQYNAKGEKCIKKKMSKKNCTKEEKLKEKKILYLRYQINAFTNSFFYYYLENEETKPNNSEIIRNSLFSLFVVVIHFLCMIIP